MQYREFSYEFSTMHHHMQLIFHNIVIKQGTSPRSAYERDNERRSHDMRSDRVATKVIGNFCGSQSQSSYS